MRAHDDTDGDNDDADGPRTALAAARPAAGLLTGSVVAVDGHETHPDLLAHAAEVSERRDLEVAQLQQLLLERAQELEELQARFTSRLVQFAHVTELERRRIAAEIHDTAVQRIAAALLLMDLGGEENLAEVRTHLEAAVEAARDLMGSIHPPLLDERGVAPAIAAELERLARRPERPLEVSFDDRLGGVALDSATELIVWRAMADTLRSSWLDPTTTAISVSVAYNGQAVLCDVVDDGVSPRDDVHPTGAPTALVTARSTAEACGGRLEAYQDTEGTRVILRIPRLDRPS